ncbi:MAG TPA: pyruvate carboxyltransferase [Anaerolineae bacterium]|nr:pyruvate carboxyltransferase [Anaerolineae bacterium]
MSVQPWKSDNWFVSPWNFADEVRAPFRFADQVQIHDITLRDGEQQTGVVFTKDDKVRIAEALAEAGIHRIEAGMPAVSAADEAAIREIVKRDLGPEIYAFSRCMIDDVKRALDCGVTGVVTEIPASEHLIEYAYQWPLDKAIDLSITATNYAHEQGLKVVFFLIDFTRSDINWVLDLVTRVADEGHMDSLALVDTFGVVSPHAMPYFVKHVQARINKPLEAHFHQDFGTGVANTLIALAEGVEVAHTTVLGVGERAGNAPLEELVVALRTMYDVDVGIDYTKLYGLAKLVEELSGHRVPTNKPIVGDQLYQIESGIVTSWLRNVGDEHVTEVFPVHWEMVGQQPGGSALGKGSGLDSVKIWSEQIGVELSDDEAMDVLLNVKQFALEKKRLLNQDDFRRIVELTVG